MFKLRPQILKRTWPRQQRKRSATPHGDPGPHRYEKHYPDMHHATPQAAAPAASDSPPDASTRESRSET